MEPLIWQSTDRVRMTFVKRSIRLFILFFILDVLCDHSDRQHTLVPELSCLFRLYCPPHLCSVGPQLDYLASRHPHRSREASFVPGEWLDHVCSKIFGFADEQSSMKTLFG